MHIGTTFKQYFTGRRDHEGMVVGFTTTYAISAYHHKRCEFESRSGEVYSIHHYVTSLCDKVCQWLTAGRWFSPCILVSSTNKADHHDITEIVLKVALNTTKQTTKESCIVLYLCLLHDNIKTKITTLLKQFQHPIQIYM